jgi:hypothetical protein
MEGNKLKENNTHFGTNFNRNLKKWILFQNQNSFPSVKFYTLATWKIKLSKSNLKFGLSYIYLELLPLNYVSSQLDEIQRASLPKHKTIAETTTVEIKCKTLRTIGISFTLNVSTQLEKGVEGVPRRPWLPIRSKRKITYSLT